MSPGAGSARTSAAYSLPFPASGGALRSGPHHSLLGGQDNSCSEWQKPTHLPGLPGGPSSPSVSFVSAGDWGQSTPSIFSAHGTPQRPPCTGKHKSLLGVSPDGAVNRFWGQESPTSRPGPQFPLVSNQAGFEMFTEPSGSYLGEACFSPSCPEQPPPRPPAFPRSQGSPATHQAPGGALKLERFQLLPAPWALLPTARERGSSRLALSSKPSSGELVREQVLPDEPSPSTNGRPKQQGKITKPRFREGGHSKHLSGTGGGETGPGLWVRACLARTIFIPSGGWGLMKFQLRFTKTLSP